MGTVLIRHWTLRCVACGWTKTQIFGDNQGSFYVKLAAIQAHREQHYPECPTGDVCVEVEEETMPATSKEAEVQFDRHIDRCEQCEIAYPDPTQFCEEGQTLYGILVQAVYAEQGKA
jgi:hypothetical protein